MYTVTLGKESEQQEESEDDDSSGYTKDKELYENELSFM